MIISPDITTFESGECCGGAGVALSGTAAVFISNCNVSSNVAEVGDGGAFWFSEAANAISPLVNIQGGASQVNIFI